MQPPTSDLNHVVAQRQMYRNMLQYQLLASLTVALVACWLGSHEAAFSALLGGCAVIIGAWIATKIVARGHRLQQPTAVLLNLLKAELIKIIVIAVVLLAVFKLYLALVPFALIAGLAAAALFSGAALAKSDVNI